jgi:hypothetical protein
MYRYLDKVLAKRTKFEIKMDDYAKRLVMPEREDKLLLKIQAAVKEMENKDLTSGRITVSKLEKRENIWWIWIERGRRSIIKKEAATTTEKKDREEMDQFEMRVYRYDAMSLEERQPLDLKIQERLSLNKWGKPGNPSYEFTRQAIIAQVMEEYLMDGIDEKGQNICTPPPNILIAKEPPAPGSEYGSDQEQKQKSLKKLALILSRVYYSKVNHNIIQKNNTLTN